MKLKLFLKKLKKFFLNNFRFSEKFAEIVQRVLIYASCNFP